MGKTIRSWAEVAWRSGLFLAVAVGAGCDAAPERVAEAPAASQPTCVTIQRGAGGEVADAKLRSDQPDTSSGASDTFVTGDQFAQRIALLSFGLAPIPMGATIQSATVTLHEVQNLGPSTIDGGSALYWIIPGPAGAIVRLAK